MKGRKITGIIVLVVGFALSVAGLQAMQRGGNLANVMIPPVFIIIGIYLIVTRGRSKEEKQRVNEMQQGVQWNNANHVQQSACKFEQQFNIQCSRIPPYEGYNALSDEEKLFLHAFAQKLRRRSIHPKDITLTRLADKTFNVNYKHGFVGKIKLQGRRKYMQVPMTVYDFESREDLSIEEFIACQDEWVKYIKKELSGTLRV